MSLLCKASAAATKQKPFWCHRRLFHLSGNQNVSNRDRENLPSSAKHIIHTEMKYTANTYHTIPVTLCQGKGVYLWDTYGKRYFDMLAGYSAISLGHCYEPLVQALQDQATKLHLTSRAFHNNVFADYAKYTCELFGYDKLLPMNSGVEAGETAIKIARKWGYKVKGIPSDEAKVVFAKNNFWGRSLAAISSSTDPESYQNYGPFMTNFSLIPYNDVRALEISLKNPNICAFMVEPIQGEAGIMIPNKNYIKEVRRLCSENNVIFIADEVQTGIGRTGKLTCCDHANVKPDLLVLGKALSGGIYPVSAVLGNDEYLTVMEPGTHGSTFGGNPLACAVAKTALQETERLKLCENSETVGDYCLSRLNKMKEKYESIETVRGKGLMMAFEVKTSVIDAWTLCLKLRDAGVLAKPTHGHIVRLCPPLIINKVEADEAFDLIENVVKSI